VEMSLLEIKYEIKTLVLKLDKLNEK